MNYHRITGTQVQAIAELCDIINDWAEKKGWSGQHDTQERRMSQIALMHSELSECVEFLRVKVECPECGNGRDSIAPNVNPGCAQCTCGRVFPDPRYDDHVPSLTGEAAELADVLIRIFHYCGEHGIDLGEALRAKHEYNITRPFRHGKTI